MNIRNVEEKDLDSLALVFTAAYEDNTHGENWTLPSAKELMKYHFSHHPELAFLAEIDGEIAGALIGLIVRPWWDGNHLIEGELFVAPKFQKKGVASSLIRSALVKAKEKHSVVKWDTLTFSDTEFPLAWYKKIGFDHIENWIAITAEINDLLNSLRDK